MNKRITKKMENKNDIQELKQYLVEWLGEKHKLSEQSAQSMLIILNSDLEAMLNECKHLDQSIKDFAEDIFTTVTESLNQFCKPSGTYREISNL